MDFYQPSPKVPYDPRLMGGPASNTQDFWMNHFLNMQVPAIDYKKIYGPLNERETEDTYRNIMNKPLVPGTQDPMDTKKRMIMQRMIQAGSDLTNA